MSALPISDTLDMPIRDADQRVFLHVDWNGFLTLVEVRGERSVPRMAYLDGVAELMSPSVHHERIKTTLARLLEAWSQRRGAFFNGYGSWLLKAVELERALEPDECYLLADPGPTGPERPDLAIEVVWTHGGLNKLAIYEALGVREVWVWKAGVITVHELGDDGYTPIPASRLLPDVPMNVLAEHCTTKDQVAAVGAFLDATAE